MWQDIREKWLKHETKIILFFGFFLVAGLAFQAGLVRGQKNKESPVIIEKTIEVKNENSLSASLPQEQKNETTSAQEKKNCVFVGSKNSNKYHLPTCRYAKNINSENKVCFSSAEEAAAKGYLPDKNCIK